MPERDRNAGGLGLRLALFYATVFTVVGIQLPYWPVWLKAKGLDATEIGMLLAASYLTKLLATPMVGHWVDRRGDRRLPLILLAAGSMLAFLLFNFAEDFWALLAVSVIAVGLFSAMMPVGDNMTMLTAPTAGLEYGRIRLWGSLTFILAATLGGRLLADRPVDIVLWLIVGGLAATILACCLLPDPKTRQASGRPPVRLGVLLANPLFLTFLAAGSLIQVSHVIYYGFATLHWRAAGLSDTAIGLLWSEGVVAEILLFAYSGAVLRRFGPAQLIVIAGLGGLLRWTVTGLSHDTAVLAIVQVLHAATFGATHLGAMHFLSRSVPHALSARAQGLYSSVTSGLAPGIALLGSGRLYEALGGHAFLVMGAIALAGGLAALRLSSRWNGSVLDLKADSASI